MAYKTKVIKHKRKGKWISGHFRLVGKNRGKDKFIQAMRPGWRISENGNKYFENRANRADAGKLL